MKPNYSIISELGECYAITFIWAVKAAIESSPSHANIHTPLRDINGNCGSDEIEFSQSTVGLHLYLFSVSENSQVNRRQ